MDPEGRKALPRSPFRLCTVLCSGAVLLFCLAVLSGCGNIDAGNAESVAVLAGAAGGQGFFDGTGALVRFASPSGATAIGTTLFVADTANHVIRKIDTATGAVTTLAGSFGVSGSADGTGGAARFHSPAGIAAVGITLYVCDTGNHTLRKIVSTSGVVTTLAGTPGTAGAADNVTGPGNVLFSSPREIATDLPGTTLFVADTGNHKIRKVVACNGATTTYAGSGVPGADNGVGNASSFSSPEGVASLGTDIYVADTGSHTIRKITPLGAVGDVTTFAGAAGLPDFMDNTTGSLARFFSPSSLAAVGTDLYVADARNQVIRKIDATSSSPPWRAARWPRGQRTAPERRPGSNGPKGIGTDGASIFVADPQNHSIRKTTIGGAVTTVAGNPPQAGTIDGAGTTTPDSARPQEQRSSGTTFSSRTRGTTRSGKSLPPVRSRLLRGTPACPESRTEPALQRCSRIHRGSRRWGPTSMWRTRGTTRSAR